MGEGYGEWVGAGGIGVPAWKASEAVPAPKSAPEPEFGNDSDDLELKPIYTRSQLARASGQWVPLGKNKDRERNNFKSLYFLIAPSI